MAAHGIVARVPAALKATVTQLPQSRVRLQVEVPAGEIEERLERKARELGRELRLPGFRRGKVPAALVIQRVGRDAVLEQAVRETLASWYSDAIARSGIVPVGDPRVDLGTLPPKGEPLAFSIEIGVLPKAQLGPYRGLEVARREPHLAEEPVEQEVEALRERLARLETVERRAAEGDYVVVDYLGSLLPAEGEEDEARPFPGGEARDQPIELGSGRLIPGFEEALMGARGGDTREVRVTFPADYAAAELAGRDASFAVSVKEVKAKELPELDDDLAVDAGFDDLAGLREDIARRLLEREEAQIEAEFREGALDAAVAQARVEVPVELVKARAQEMWERMLHALSHRGVSREAYLQIVGRPEPELLAEMEPEAEQALRREAVITAVVAAEQIEPSEDELREALAPTAEREGVDPAQLLVDLDAAGRLEEVREDLAARQAIDLIAATAVPIPPSQAQAREQLWTPEKAAAGATTVAETSEPPARLWTPTDARSSS
jgi:trigger factor